MPAHVYEYNGSQIDMPFSEGDRVAMFATPRNPDAKRKRRGGKLGQVVTVNHDDVDNIVFLVHFDEPVGSYEGPDGTHRPVRNELIPADRLEFIQSNVDWAIEKLRSLAAQPHTQLIVDEMKVVRLRYDAWTKPAVEPDAADKVAELLDGLPG